MPTVQAYFAWNLAGDGDANTKIIFIIEEAKEIKLDFSDRKVKVLWIYMWLVILMI